MASHLCINTAETLLPKYQNNPGQVRYKWESRVLRVTLPTLLTL